MARINVVGTSGSGKSTFARRLASILTCPHLEMDAIFWKENWSHLSDEEFEQALAEKLAGEAWVLDGNYTRTIPVKWQRVRTVVWLDYSFPRTLGRTLKRAVVRAWTKQEIWPGTNNYETFKKSFFSKESIIWWSVSNFRKVRKKYLSLMVDEKFSHLEFIRLRSPKMAEEYLQRVRLGQK